MKKVGFIVFLAAIAIGVLFGNVFSYGKVTGSVVNFSFFSSVKGSGISATESRQITNFSAISVSNALEVEITAQKGYGVEVTADDNIVPLISTEVSDGVLRIYADEKFKAKTPVRIRVSAPEVNMIRASGASKVSLADASSTDLSLRVSGASRLTAAGRSEQLNVRVSGAGKVDAEGLEAKDAEIRTSGAAKVSVFVTGNLKTSASGGSKITYSGTPTNVESRSSGGSTIASK